MNRVVVLDSGPLGMIAHPQISPNVEVWLTTLDDAGAMIAIPEIADYEVRREFLLGGRTKSLARLDFYKVLFGYVHLTPDTMLLAADLWAQVRKQGTPTADDKALDGDVILAAQVMLLVEDGLDVTVAATNVKHLSLLVDAREWDTITE